MVFAEENSWPNMLLLAQIQLSSQKHDSERKSRPDKGTVNMAERVGFEPTIRLPVCRISSAVLSTTQPPLRFAGRRKLCAGCLIAAKNRAGNSCVRHQQYGRDVPWPWMDVNLSANNGSRISAGIHLANIHAASGQIFRILPDPRGTGGRRRADAIAIVSACGPEPSPSRCRDVRAALATVEGRHACRRGGAW